MTIDPQKPDDHRGPAQPMSNGPGYGEAQPLPPQQERMLRLPLPLNQPRAIWVLLVLIVVIFVVPTLLQFIGVRLWGYPINDVIEGLGAKNNLRIKVNGEYYRLLTAMFLHAGWLHAAVNAYSLYAVGPETERIYGTWRFLTIYFLAGIAGSVASYAFSAALSVGASGAIFGLVGALAVFFYVARDILGDAAKFQLRSLLTVIMINLFIGFSSGGVIDNFAHLGGLAGGALLGWLLSPRFLIDARLYPPQVVRQWLTWGWVGVIGFLAFLVLLIFTINPPMQ